MAEQSTALVTGANKGIGLEIARGLGGSATASGSQAATVAAARRRWPG